MKITTFHLALPTRNINAIRAYYVEKLGCATGRSDSTWIDIDFFGHQLTFQEVAVELLPPNNPIHPQLGYPLRHAGLVMLPSEWIQLKELCMKRKIEFAFGPQTLMDGEVGEQQVFMIKDPDDNYWEFKCFRQPKNLFQKQL